MALNLDKKKIIVTKFKEINKKAISIVIADFSGINVNSITELRKNGRNNNIIIHVIRNKLLKLIIQNSHFKYLIDKIYGPILVGYSFDHPGTAARLFKNFAQTNNNFKIKAAVFNNKLYDKNIDMLAELPTYKEAISILLKFLKNITVEQLIYVLFAINKK
ncbi:50S ribosomal protein L10 [Enterobacteriaceae endosymbiont of Neohaemonia nigricornis]|uniref:50S ribosomal protein L10 n=1 Tax=Enterobacteriaceae endosymbiont of Neohaemonia nigricornis TaxID=2675792 RepID=UPI0014493D57|nr:50S ribosomal protein L10 [Enterobacteriaceae endosymbiont of Neohaemonia nigricornis]QJC30506.1 50S ribosomal protein L10 [Enterobacteriaceae endosymbiont of Neohaemonia nigricornis]